MKSILPFAAAVMFVAVPARAETMNNDSVIALTLAGLGDDIIIAKINSSETAFSVSTSDLVSLKTKGVSSAVITAMIDSSPNKDQRAESADSADPMVRHPIGIYLLDDSTNPQKMVKIDPSGSSQMKVGNTLGYAFSYGIAPITMKVSINGDQAHVQTGNHQPVFYLFSAQADGQSSNPYSIIGSLAFMSITSPNDFSLIRLISKSGHREAKVGNYNISGAQTGVMDKDRVQFQYTKVREGVFKLTAAGPLASGEYAFLKGMMAGASVFDFSVR